MKTVVYQSFRTIDVPDTITRCLRSVEAWAGMRGHDYRFLDDALFDRVPVWFQEKVRGNRLPMSDLARLKVGRDLLQDRYERVVWLDADVLVFDPEAFDISIATDYAFGREVWVRRGRGDGPMLTEGLHNAVCVFCQGNTFLDFYIDACEAIVRNAQAEVLSHQIGPDFLNAQRDTIGTRIEPDVGLFSPLVIADIARGGGPALACYVNAHGSPVRAANLCLSFVGRASSGVTVTEAMLCRAIDRLIETRGDVVNQSLTSASEIHP